MEPESSLPHLQKLVIYPYIEPDQSTPFPQYIFLKILLNIKLHLCLGLASVQIDIYVPKTITSLQIFPHNISRTVQDDRRVPTVHLSFCRCEVCFRHEDGSSMFLRNTYTNTLEYTKLSQSRMPHQETHF